MRNKVRLAVLDLYDGTPNQGMRAIKEILEKFKDEVGVEIFDFRKKHEFPGTDFDIYISSGGPGSPLEGDGVWELEWARLMDELWAINEKGSVKKFVFFICHSFQMACHHFEIAKITKRHKKSFGTYRARKTKDGKKDVLLSGLEDPFWMADFRDFQVIQPDEEKMDSIGATILALEKIRPHVPLERAIMAVRFSPYFVGTQFHPEADPKGMWKHFMDESEKTLAISLIGEEKFERMISHLEDPDKIEKTFNQVLPGFIRRSVKQLKRDLITIE